MDGTRRSARARACGASAGCWPAYPPTMPIRSSATGWRRVNPRHAGRSFYRCGHNGTPVVSLDTPDADQRRWRESKDSVARSPTTFSPPRVRVCSSGEHGRGAKGEQTGALNGPELHSTAPNGPAPTCESCISAGRRTMASLVHTYELLQLRSTDLNCIKPQVNGPERPRREPPPRVSS